MVDCGGRIEESAAVGKAIRRDIDDPHDQRSGDRQRAVANLPNEGTDHTASVAAVMGPMGLMGPRGLMGPISPMSPISPIRPISPTTASPSATQFAPPAG